MKIELIMISKHETNGSEEKSMHGLLREEAMVGIARPTLLCALMAPENRGAPSQALGMVSGVQSGWREGGRETKTEVP